MSILSDTEIKSKIIKNELIQDGVISNIGPACYELRMGSIYYDLTEGDKRIDASEYEYILIKPSHRVVLITWESLKIPNNIIARIASKGSLFSIGLSPVNTYADPGFEGNIGLVTQNFSDKYIKIPIGESVAKVDFSLLSSASENPYKGQHGYKTEIWPIKHQLQKSYKEIKTDPRMGTEEEEALKLLPQATVSILKNLKRQQRKIKKYILFFLIISIFNLVALSTNLIELFSAFSVNLISAVITTFLIGRSIGE